jgi:hypothetical protein
MWGGRWVFWASIKPSQAPGIDIPNPWLPR